MSHRKKSEKDKERARLWRLNNPDKVRAQQERRLLRAHGLLEPFTPPESKPAEQIKSEQAERMKRFHSRRQERLATDPEFAAAYRAKARETDRLRYQARKADPEAHAAWLAYKRENGRIRRRLKRGLPPDAPLHCHRLTDEERARRKAEWERIKAERAANRPPRVKLTDAERKERKNAAQRAKYQAKRDAERQKRGAEVATAKAMQPKPQPPKACPDPPALQALFAKASKGQRPMDPYYGKKLGAFTARAKWI